MVVFYYKEKYEPISALRTLHLTDVKFFMDLIVYGAV